ncbi:hypothetical protein ACJMK2_018671 [Sinanodonta woodiana]|uniref:Protein MIS12 homolog n=1 Tax=Sinanodonta woodiana TaxID=1069815 RepID=A0ABD3UHQ3_SINWO
MSLSDSTGIESDFSANSLSITASDGSPGSQIKNFMHQEYATQYFGFTPQSFINGIYNAMVEYIHDAMEALETCIQQEFSDVITPEQTNEATRKLQSYLGPKIDACFDYLEKYLMKNIFIIPADLVLPEDKHHEENHYTLEEDRTLDEKIAAVRTKILAVKYANSKLQQRLKDIAAVKNDMDKFLSQLETLSSLIDAEGVSDVKDALIHTVEKVKRLTEIVQEMKSS